MINLTINGKACQATDGSTILEAARQNNIHIPTLCYKKDIHQFGACRICVVEVKGAKTLQASCIVKATEGMVVETHSKRVRDARKVLYELIISNHNRDCLSCSRNSQSCELQALGREIGVTDCRFPQRHPEGEMDISYSITRDLSKCILCRRCVTVCGEVQGTSILSAQERGINTRIEPAMGLALGEVDCAMCGQCVAVCPVGALKETDSKEKVWHALHDPDTRVIVQVAPAVRAAIGEPFGLPIGTRCTGRLAAALHRMGFDDVFDTNFAADMTIMEEGTEFLQRAKSVLTGSGAVLPMITSCSPGWVKFCEHTFPDQLDHLSTCKSPHTMFGAVAKSWYAEKIETDPKKMFVVSVMPCTAKKTEIVRHEMQNDGMPNVDAVITTRELADMIVGSGIDFVNLPDEEFDRPMGLSTGAADIFGVTGGVMEAALRTVYELVTGRELPVSNLHIPSIMGLDQIREGIIKFENVKDDFKFLEGFEAKVAVTSGLAGARKLLDQIKSGTSPYHFIEVMGCPNGCITGGGQPRVEDINQAKVLRQKALYDEDESKVLRKSHENPDLMEFYKEWGDPCGHRSHEYLHTHYVKRGKYNEFTEERFVVTPSKTKA